MSSTIHHGDCLEVLRAMPDATFDGILTDPPYALAFMGKAWDKALPPIDVWREALRVVKPGAFIFAFGGTRTFHRLTCSLEDAGWLIRDVMCWLYGSGFPKSLDVSKAIRVRTVPATPDAQRWQGYGTSLKPAWEPIIVAMKPMAGSFAENAIQHGGAGLNIDGCRVPAQGGSPAATRRDTARRTGNVPTRQMTEAESNAIGMIVNRAHPDVYLAPRVGEQLGRWPANLVLDEVSAGQLGKSSRFFYCAKASKTERGTGNVHPTVKPLALAEYIARLLLPPKRDTPRRLLVPYAGSGSELIGAVRAGWDEAVGIEIDAKYVRIAEERIASATP